MATTDEEHLYMFLRISVFQVFFWCVGIQAASLSGVWWDGRASFKGQVIASTCTLFMEDSYQVVYMGEIPVRDLQNTFVGPEKKFRLRLQGCDLAETGKQSRVRVTFDGLQGEAPDRFSLIGKAEGINLRILDKYGYTARVGKVMSPLLLTENGGDLDYTLQIVRNDQPLKAGNYYAILSFKIDYE